MTWPAGSGRIVGGAPDRAALFGDALDRAALVGGSLIVGCICARAAPSTATRAARSSCAPAAPRRNHLCKRATRMQLPPLPETAEEPDEEEGEYVEEQLTSSYFTEESLGPAPEVILDDDGDDDDDDDPPPSGAAGGGSILRMVGSLLFLAAALAIGTALGRRLALRQRSAEPPVAPLAAKHKHAKSPPPPPPPPAVPLPPPPPPATNLHYIAHRGSCAASMAQRPRTIERDRSRAAKAVDGTACWTRRWWRSPATPARSFVLEEAGDDGYCAGDALRDELLAGVGEATARENLVTCHDLRWRTPSIPRAPCAPPSASPSPRAPRSSTATCRRATFRWARARGTQRGALRGRQELPPVFPPSPPPAAAAATTIAARRTGGGRRRRRATTMTGLPQPPHGAVDDGGAEGA